MRTTTSEWFIDLHAEGREDVLHLLHEARQTLTDTKSHSSDSVSLLAKFISHLEEDHEEAKRREAFGYVQKLRKSVSRFIGKKM